MNKGNISRIIELSKQDDIILFGPRGAGKSTLLKELFDSKECLWIDLLLPKQEARYGRDPELLIAEVEGMLPTQTHIVIDEIQKVPKLLDVVHYLIENTNKHFILTGSSARKIKRASANLLAGRAFVHSLAPFTFQELGKSFHLNKALHYGMLPKIYTLKTETQQKQYLKSYAHTYLKEEVWVEQFIKNLDPFRYFLEVAAQCNGKVLNYSKIGRDVGVDHKTVENYYSILVDTLLGFILPAHANSFRKQLRQAPKFYFFDVGVTRALGRLLSVPVSEQTSYYGEVFEHFIMAEISKYINYFKDEYRLSYICTKNNIEIDLVVSRPAQPLLLVEIKSSSNVTAEQVSKLEKIAQDIPNCEAICLSRDDKRKKFGSVTVWPWRDGILEYFHHSTSMRAK